MTFQSRKLIAGFEQRVSKQTNQPYVIITYLNENGSTFQSILDANADIPEGVKQLSVVDVDFQVTFFNNKVSGLKTKSIKLVRNS